MSRDAERRIRDEVSDVLDEYQIPYEHVIRKKHPAVEFQLNGRRMLFTYSGSGDVRAHMNARSSLRNILVRGGAKLPILTLASKVISTQDNDAQEAPPVEVVSLEPAVVEPEVISEEIMDDDLKPEVVEEAQAPEESPPPPQPPPPEPKVTVPPGLNDGGYTLYQSARVIAVELDRDLLVAKGNVLVIPLHKANVVVDLPRDQFHALFMQVPAEAEPIAPVAPVRQPRKVREPRIPQVNPWEELAEAPEDELPDEVVEEVEPSAPQPPWTNPDLLPQVPDSAEAASILRWMQGRKAVQISAIAKAFNKTYKSVDGHMRRMQARGLVSPGPPGFWSPSLPSRQVSQPVPPPPHPGDTKRSRAGVPAQMGRILTAMAYVTKTGQTDLSTSMVVPYLAPNDARQYGARMPALIEKGLVARSIPLEVGHGWHHKLTPDGWQIVQQLKAWAYQADELPIPDWVGKL